ncbi:hypothetical protein H0G86_000461 [Trichoderma simmonsii]|uniref:Cytochrome P450 monooxygenase n=1 Tax=Trichoderma simmonsii TaxID=1491479 RepID=A0A8G0KZN5_9HYPO|nr:hypothetical protein H0G86_000461 [Trichoderma simmonsii]
MASLVVGQVAVVLIGFLLYQLFFRNKSKFPLPPGPKPLPIVGNIRDLPPPGTPDFRHWLPFKEKYGPISSVTLLGRTLVIIQDKEAAVEYLEKNSSKTSSRPQFEFANMCGYGTMLAFMDYTDLFRQHRKFVHHQFGTTALVSRFNGVQEIESKRFLMRIFKEPESLFQHIKTEAAATILKIVYGYSVEPFGADPLVRIINDVMENASRAMLPFKKPVEIFPALKRLPDWMPGAGFKRLAREWLALTDASAYIPYNHVKKQMENGTYQPSYVSELIQTHGKGKNMEPDEDTKEAIVRTAQMLFTGGADTTVAAIMAFVLAMIHHPEVQEKAQEELDRVVGTDRLPTYEDRPNLPYINAFMKEMLRWFTVAPVNTAHKNDEEIIFRGYRIPKGSYTVASNWWFLHDPKTYANPMAFDPDRYLAPRNEPDPTGMFGYGRRICPGRFFAQENLFITVSQTLAVFKITHAVDENGKPMETVLRHTPGLIDHPQEFPYSIAPRNEKCIELLKRLEVESPWEESNAEDLEWGSFTKYQEEHRRSVAERRSKVLY